MSNTFNTRRTGFTLVELLAVIAVIGILAAILIPVVSSVRKRANEATCLANLRQVGALILIYATDSKGLLPASSSVESNWDDELLERGFIIDFSLTRQGCRQHEEDLTATYGYNYMQLGNTSDPLIGRRNLNQIEIPSKTIMAADGHNLPATTWPNLVYWDDDFWLGSRKPLGHRGGVNIVWSDGHVSWKPHAEVYGDPSQKLEDMTLGYSLRVPYYFARTKSR